MSISYCPAASLLFFCLSFTFSPSSFLNILMSDLKLADADEVSLTLPLILTPHFHKPYLRSVDLNGENDGLTYGRVVSISFSSGFTGAGGKKEH